MCNSAAAPREVQCPRHGEEVPKLSQLHGDTVKVGLPLSSVLDQAGRVRLVNLHRGDADPPGPDLNRSAWTARHRARSFASDGPRRPAARTPLGVSAALNCSRVAARARRAADHHRQDRTGREFERDVRGSFARSERVTLSLICSGLAHSIIWPREVTAALNARIARVLGDADHRLADLLAGRGEDPAKRRGLTARVTELAQLLEDLDLDFDTARIRPGRPACARCSTACRP
jgi:hypothetical protein